MIVQSLNPNILVFVESDLGSTFNDINPKFYIYNNEEMFKEFKEEQYANCIVDVLLKKFEWKDID